MAPKSTERTKRIGPKLQRQRIRIFNEIELQSKNRASPRWRDQAADLTSER